jgi:hypothetical protein
MRRRAACHSSVRSSTVLCTEWGLTRDVGRNCVVARCLACARWLFLGNRRKRFSVRCCRGVKACLAEPLAFGIPIAPIRPHAERETLFERVSFELPSYSA